MHEAYLWNLYECILYMLLGASFLAHMIISFMKSLRVQDIQRLLHHSRLHLVSMALETKRLRLSSTSVTTSISADPSPLNLASMLLRVQYGWSLATVLCGGSQTPCLFSCINCSLTGNLSPCININKMAAAHTCSSHITTVCQSKHINTSNQTNPPTYIRK